MSLTQRSTGRDLLPLLRERLPHADPAKWSFCAWLFDRFGVFPTTGDNHVGEYIAYAAEFVGTKGYNFGAYARNRPLGKRTSTPGPPARSPSPRSSPALARIAPRPRLHAIMARTARQRTIRRPSFIIPNDGYIENLPHDAVVEVPGIIEDGAFRGMQVGRLAEPVAAMVRDEIAIEELAVEAAVTGSRRPRSRRS